MSTSWPLVKYVDSPSTSATVRYDFNDQAPTPGTGPVKKVTAFDPGVPTLEGDPDAVGQQWGFRSPSITHIIRGTKAQAMAALSAVSKEQLRRTNWLLFQPAAAQQPVWFKTYRTGYQPITLDQVYVRVDGGGTAPMPDTWKITVPLVADAFAYGARVTIPSVSIVQSPADLAGPTRYALRYVLPALKGDAPTGLRVTITPSSTGVASRGTSWLIGCVSGTSAMTNVVVDIGTGDGFTGGTVVTTNPTLWYSGSHRAFSISAGAGALGTVLTGNLPNVPAGRYKVLARYEIDGSTSGTKVVNFRLFTTVSLSAPYYYYGKLASASVEVSATPWIGRGWVDLGDFNIPAGTPITSEAVIGQAAPSTGLLGTFGLDVGIPDNTATTFRLDAFVFVPIQGPAVSDANLIASSWAGSYFPQYVSAGPITLAGTWDTDTELFWVTASGTQTGLLASSPAMKGRFPLADPTAATNILYAIATEHGVGTTSSATTTVTSRDSLVTLDVSYLPRYLHVGDGT